MARDVFVHWKSEAPSTQDVQAALEDYTAGLGAQITWAQDRFMVTLPGVPSYPFQRVGPATEAQRKAWVLSAREDDGSPRRRWFEVWLDDESMDVITRDMDEITNAVAREFAVICARGWRGRLQEG